MHYRKELRVFVLLWILSFTLFNLTSLVQFQDHNHSLSNEISDERVLTPESDIISPHGSDSEPFMKYSRQAAYGYAYKWYNDYNPHYNDYSSSGGDCANFVSQCLIAGGLSLYNGTDGNGYGVYPDTDRTTQESYGAIVFCDYLNTHLRDYQDTNVTYVVEGSEYVPDEITVGDVVIFGDDGVGNDKYEHAMIVVWDGGDKIGLAGHSNPVWNRSYSTELGFSAFNCSTFYHIKNREVQLYQFQIDTSVLNVRVGPGKNALGNNYQDIGNLYDGDEYIAYEREKDDQGRWWWHFYLDDRTAWTAAWFTVNTTGNRVIKTDVTNYLNVRDGPTTGDAIYGQVYDGMKFVSSGMSGSWYQYWYDGAQKYSHGGSINEIEISQTQEKSFNFSKAVMGFLPYWVSSDQNYSIVSHLAWFSIEMNSDGSIGNTHGWPEWDVINEVHDKGNKIILTVTMFDSTDIHTLMSSYKTTAANNLLAQVQAGNADGICIDFEHPKQTGDDELLVQFMNTLYDTFKAARNDYHVSLCTPSVDWWGTYDYGSLSPYVDAFMLMGYGYSGTWSTQAGPTSPLEGRNLNLNKSVNDHINGGAPESKIILGLPFYGYDFPVENSEEGAPVDESRSISSRFYSNVKSLISTYNPFVNYSDDAECAWFNYNDGSGLRQVWFDNYTSLERKFDYINERDLGGLGIWAWGYQGLHTELENLIVEKFCYNSSQVYPPEDLTLMTTATDPDVDGQFYLNWTESIGAETYTIYKSSSPILSAGSGQLYETGLSTNFSLISNILTGEYYFAVVAINDTGETLSNNLFINVSLSLELDTTAGNPDRDGEYMLEWSSSMIADNFSLYSYSHPIIEINDSLTLIADGMENFSYSLTGLADGSIIYYIIVAFQGSINLTSNYLKIWVSFGLPGEFIAMYQADMPDSDGIFRFNWTISEGANNYTIYRYHNPISEINESLIIAMAPRNTTEFIISGMENGIYYYMVFAENDYGNVTSQCFQIIVILDESTESIDDGDQEKELDESLNLIESILSQGGLIIIGAGVGIAGVIIAGLLRRDSHKSSAKERERLQKISSDIRKNKRKPKTQE